ncbi:MAG: outer membrane protein [Yoonia sp.]
MLAAPLALAAGMASAGGLAAPVETVAPTPIAPAPAPVMRGSDWTGFYLGGQLGYGDVTISADPEQDDLDGIIGGVHAGYMYDLGTIVLGAEVDYDLADISGAVPALKTGVEVDDILRLKARVGYDAGAFLPYATGGVVRANLSTDDGSIEADGDFYGLGVAYKFSDSILVGGEVLQHKFYEGDDGVQGNGVRATTATARVSFQF